MMPKRIIDTINSPNSSQSSDSIRKSVIEACTRKSLLLAAFDS
jgi:hypothetical protein